MEKLLTSTDMSGVCNWEYYIDNRMPPAEIIHLHLYALYVNFVIEIVGTLFLLDLPNFFWLQTFIKNQKLYVAIILLLSLYYGYYFLFELICFQRFVSIIFFLHVRIPKKKNLLQIWFFVKLWFFFHRVIQCWSKKGHFFNVE